MPAPTNSSAQPQGWPQLGVSGYEKSDLPAKWIFWFFVALFATGIAIHLLIRWQLGSLSKAPPPEDSWTTPRRVENRAVIPPREFPRLQISPAADMEALRVREEAELNSYGWVDRTAGVARIPINRAMDLLLQKGLPVRPSPDENKIGPSSLELQQQRPGRRNDQ